MIRKFIEKAFSVVEHILSLSTPVKLFYLALIFFLTNTIVYKFILIPDFFIIILILLVSEIIRSIFHRFLILLFLDSNSITKGESSNIPIFLFILQMWGVRAMNTNAIFFWTDPIDVDYKHLVKNRALIVFLSFGKTIASILLISIFYPFYKLKNPLMLATAVKVIIVNVNLIVTNLVPFPPFELGIALDNLLNNSIVNKIKPYGQILALLFYRGFVLLFIRPVSIIILNFLG